MMKYSRILTIFKTTPFQYLYYTYNSNRIQNQANLARHFATSWIAATKVKVRKMEADKFQKSKTGTRRILHNATHQAREKPPWRGRRTYYNLSLSLSPLHRASPLRKASPMVAMVTVQTPMADRASGFDATAARIQFLGLDRPTKEHISRSSFGQGSIGDPTLSAIRSPRCCLLNFFPPPVINVYREIELQAGLMKRYRYRSTLCSRGVRLAELLLLFSSKFFVEIDKMIFLAKLIYEQGTRC